MGIAICTNSDCPKKDTCFRFLEKQGEIINFKTICNEGTKYQWYWKSEIGLTEIKKEPVHN